MKGKDFEEVILHRLRQERELGRATMGRYGVQGSFSKGKPFELAPYVQTLADMTDRDQVETVLREVVWKAEQAKDGWRPLQSLPDFEGLLPPRGMAFCFDAKVCGEATFPLREDSTTASRQLRHMLERDQFGATCFYAIHFTERKLARAFQPAETWAFPVSLKLEFWQAFERGEQKRISREDCREYGAEVEWNCLPGKKKDTPDIVMAIYELAGKLGKGTEVEDAE